MNKIIIGLLAVILVLEGVLLLKPSKPGNLIVNSSPTSFGATSADQITNWVGGSFTGDVSVGGDLAITGTTTLSGIVSGVPKALSTSMSSSATTTACTFLNSSGVTRVVLGAGVVDRGSATSLGGVAWQAGTSTYSGANGSSAVAYTKVINTTTTRLSGVDVITTTSTLLGTSGAYSTWQDGSYFNFISGTTTNSGSCKVLYY